MESAVRWSRGVCLGVIFQAEREVNAGIEELTRRLRRASETVENPTPRRMRFADAEKNVIGSYAMDDEWKAETFGYLDLSLKDALLLLDRGAAEAVDSTFADGHDIGILPGDGFETFESFVRRRRVPWVNPHAVKSLGIDGVIGSDAQNCVLPWDRAVGMDIGKSSNVASHGRFKGLGRSRFRPRDGTARCA